LTIFLKLGFSRSHQPWLVNVLAHLTVKNLLKKEYFQSINSSLIYKASLFNQFIEQWTWRGNFGWALDWLKKNSYNP
jgi:hypothetical protein